MITLEAINDTWDQRDKENFPAEVMTAVLRSKVWLALFESRLGKDVLSGRSELETLGVFATTAIAFGLLVGYEIAKKERMEELIACAGES